MPTATTSATTSYCLYRYLARNRSFHSACISVTELELNGNIAADLLHQILQAIIQEHPLLTAHLDHEGGDWLIDRGGAMAVIFEQPEPIELIDLAPDEREAELEWILLEAIEEAIDLATPPLVRYQHVRLADEHSIILLFAHRAVFDDRSREILAEAFASLYAELLSGHKFLPYSRQEKKNGQTTATNDRTISRKQRPPEDCAQYWKKLFANFPVPLDLPLEPGQTNDPTYYTAKRSILLPMDLRARGIALATNEHVLMPVLFLAALTLLLQLYSDENDISVSVPFDSRIDENANAIGPLTGILAVRSDWSSCSTIADLLAHLNNQYNAAFAHGAQAPDCALFASALENRLSENLLDAWPWLQVMFRFESIDNRMMTRVNHVARLKSPKVSTSIHHWAFILSEQDDRWTLTLEYNTEHFLESTAGMVLEIYQAILAEMVADAQGLTARIPERLCSAAFSRLEHDACGLFPRSRRSAAGHKFRDRIETNIVDVFRDKAATYTNNVAIKTSKEEWTYARLAHEANRVAQAIVDLCGTGNGRTALLFRQEPSALAAMLGSLLAAKTYVPMEISTPAKRLREIIDDARISVLLTTNEHIALVHSLDLDKPVLLLDMLPDHPLIEPLQLDISPATPAYIIYTSGSTGKPKGVLQSHRNVLYHNMAYVDALNIGQDDRVALLPSYIFDAAVMDIFGALLHGATLHMYDLKQESSVEINERIASEGVTVFHSTPTVYRYLLEGIAADFKFLTIRFVVLGGESINRLDFDAYRRHFPHAEALISTYSATESTVAMMTFLTDATDRDQPMAVGGHPVEGTDIMLMNSQGIETPVYGEICIKSAHVALGYWGQPGLTKAVFMDDAQSGLRIYRSGDMGRLLADGSIRCCGRKDSQVKVRGNRVELGEIEAIMGEHDRIEQGVVVALHLEDAGETRLHAIVRIRDGGANPTDQELKAFLMQRLPNYMIPSSFTWIHDFPLTASGKIDRKKLKEFI